MIAQVKDYLAQTDPVTDRNLTLESIANIVAQMRIQPCTNDQTNVNMALLGKRTKFNSYDKRADSIRQLKR